MVLDHETSQRAHMLLKHQTSNLRDHRVGLGREALGLILVIPLEHEQVVNLIQGVDKVQERHRHVVGEDAA